MKTISQYFFTKKMLQTPTRLTEDTKNVILTIREFNGYIDVVKYSNWLIKVMNLAINEYKIDLVTCVKLILDNKLEGTKYCYEFDYCNIFLDTIDNNHTEFKTIFQHNNLVLEKENL